MFGKYRRRSCDVKSQQLRLRHMSKTHSEYQCIYVHSILLLVVVVVEHLYTLATTATTLLPLRRHRNLGCAPVRSVGMLTE